MCYRLTRQKPKRTNRLTGRYHHPRAIKIRMASAILIFWRREEYIVAKQQSVAADRRLEKKWNQSISTARANLR